MLNELWSRNRVPSLKKLFRIYLWVERLEERTVPTVTVNLSVAGVDGAHSSCGCLPPDTNGAAGPSNVVEVVNTAMDIFNKSGTLVSGPTSLPTFFSGHGFTVNSLSDPVITFDDSIVNATGPNGRFIIAILDFTSASATDFLDFAISNDADATHGFTNFRHVNVGETTNFADQPRLGYNADAYFVQFNMFSTASGAYTHPQIFTIQKSDFLTGGLTTFHHDQSSSIFSVDPAVSHGTSAGAPEYFITEGAVLGQLAVIKETNVLSNTPTDVTTNLPVASYNQPPAAPQPSGTVTTNDSRMLTASWRDNILVGAHTVEPLGTTTARVRWYQVDTSSTPTLNQTGDINPGTGIATYFPSADINANDTIGMTYIESSSSEFVSMYVTGRTTSDATGTMETGVRAKAGTTNYSGTRMGDYSGTSIDPSDGTTFWSENEFITASGAGSWNTAVASFTVTAPATHVAFGVQPSNTVAGQTITPAVTVKVEDASNNVVTGDNTDKVTLAIGTNPGGGTLSGTPTMTVQNGVATFSDLSIDKAGTGYTLTASSTGLTGDTSASFNITSSSSADLSLANSGPATGTEGDNLTYTITVTNGGPNDAQSTVLTDTLGANLQFVSATTSQGSFTQAAGVITFSLGTVTNGTTVTATVTAQSTEDGNLTNSASVSSSTSDPNTGNNSFDATTAVAEAPIVVSNLALTNNAKKVNNVPVATFTHANGVEPASAFAATISWGDGSSSSGTTTQSGTTYTVTGSHTYAKIGVHTVTTTVTENLPEPVREAAAPLHVIRQTLTMQQLEPVFQEALRDWQAAGASPAQLATLSRTPLHIAILPSTYLGEEAADQVWISPNASGWGWYLDISAGSNHLFPATAGNPAYGRMDLRSVLDHELGHVLGLIDSDDLDDVMGETLAAGVRRLPSASDLFAGITPTGVVSGGAASTSLSSIDRSLATLLVNSMAPRSQPRDTGKPGSAATPVFFGSQPPVIVDTGNRGVTASVTLPPRSAILLDQMFAAVAVKPLEDGFYRGAFGGADGV